MNLDKKLAPLLEQWEASRLSGEELSAENLAEGDSLLQQALERKISLLKEMDWMEEETVDFGCPCGDVTDATPDGPLSVPSLLNQRYRLEHLIAAGGFGQVWKAQDTVLLREVAIKISIINCVEEARKVARLKHQGIVTVHDVGQTDDFCFIVFDLIDGTDLAEQLTGGPLRWREAVRIAAQVAEHLEYAHGQGLIHRDVKPANILIDSKGNPVLADFGIAITAKELSTETATTVGTIAYMAPEQLQAGKAVDHRCDIYGLGTVLFQMVTGTLPFESDSLWDLRQKILEQPAPNPGERVDMPDSLEALILKALQKDKEARFGTAEEMKLQLQRLMGNASH